MQVVQLNFINLKADRNSIVAMLPKFKNAAQSSHYQIFTISDPPKQSSWHIDITFFLRQLYCKEFSLIPKNSEICLTQASIKPPKMSWRGNLEKKEKFWKVKNYFL